MINIGINMFMKAVQKRAGRWSRFKLRVASCGFRVADYALRAKRV